MGIEIQILDWIQNCIRTPFGDLVMPILTSFSNNGEVWIILGIVLLFFRKTRKLGITLLLALLLDLIFCDNLLKPLIARTRPFVVNPAAKVLVELPSSYSFPSGHTAVSFSAAMALVFGKAKKWLWIPAVVLASLIAFSRLYVYVHYPTDILAGIALGTLLGFASSRIVDAAEKLIKKRKKAKTIEE